ncbi:unnamed protein product [Peniophora sp. CBMAI 1063]|nr:unnamed protein product [Peniophora sp. CBMAI 1063]
MLSRYGAGKTSNSRPADAMLAPGDERDDERSPENTATFKLQASRALSWSAFIGEVRPSKVAPHGHLGIKKNPMRALLVHWLEPQPFCRLTHQKNIIDSPGFCLRACSFFPFSSMSSISLSGRMRFSSSLLSAFVLYLFSCLALAPHAVAYGPFSPLLPPWSRHFLAVLVHALSFTYSSGLFIPSSPFNPSTFPSLRPRTPPLLLLFVHHVLHLLGLLPSLATLPVLRSLFCFYTDSPLRPRSAFCACLMASPLIYATLHCPYQPLVVWFHRVQQLRSCCIRRLPAVFTPLRITTSFVLPATICPLLLLTNFALLLRCHMIIGPLVRA